MLASPSGLSIQLELEAATSATRADELLEGRSAAIRELLAVPGEVPASNTSPWRGRTTMHSHRFESRRDGVARVAQVSCVVDGELALTAFASWSTENLTAPSELEAALAGVRFLNRPVIEVRPDVAGEAVRRNSRRPPVSEQMWTDMRQAWLQVRPPQLGQFETTVWSPDELASLATILGAPTFPTVETGWFASLPQATVRAVLETVIRSLYARDLVRMLANGSAAVAEELTPVLETAVFPDLSVTVESSGDSASIDYFGIRPDRAVRVSVRPNGTRECVEFVVAGLVDAICSTAGFEEDTEDATSGERVLTIADLDDAGCDIKRLVRIDTAWREGGGIAGAVMWFTRDTGGGWWFGEQHDRATPDAMSWTLTRTDPDAARELVIGGLPGS